MSRARDFADLASAYSGGALANRNIVDNGNFAVHQRGGTITGLGDTNLDRWKTSDSGNIDNLTIEITQSADTPDGVGDGYSLKYQTKTEESDVAADEFVRFMQVVEAQDLARLCYGTSSAKSVTLSFWVKSSLTGTFGVSLYQEDGDDIIGSTYAISSADTWEKKTVTFSGNTSQAITIDTGAGFYVQWGLWVGSNFTGTSSSSWGSYANAKLFNGHTQNGLGTTDESTWQLAFVQLELGEVATAFEHISISDNLAKCQRYFWRVEASGNNSTRFATGQAFATTGGETYHYPPVTMRAIPAVGQTGTASNYAFYEANSTIACSGVPTVSSGRSKYLQVLYTNVSSGLTAGRALSLMANSTTAAYIDFNAEL